MTRSLTTRLLPALTLTLAAAACGHGSDSVTQTLKPAAVVRAAAVTTSQQHSSRLVIASTSVVGAVTVNMTGEGAFDYVKHTGHLSMTLPGGAGTLDEILLGDTMYLKIPAQGAAYYTLPLKDVTGTQLGSSADPTASLQALIAISDDVKTLEKVTVRGAETTHYSGTYDLKRASEQVHGLAKRMLQTLLTSGTTTTVPFDAYVDPQGRLRKLVQNLTTTSPKLGGQTITVKSTIELYDFGLAVNVQKPAATRDGSALLAALKKAFPGSS
jgi:hypothetical protein